MDRAIVLALRRKGPDEKVERLRHAEPDLFDMLASKLARFGEDHGAAIGRAKPALPDALNDRAQDNWEPLLAIADFAGGRWPTEARRAALAISGESEQELSIGEQLLAAIRDAFEQDSADKLSREELLRRLVSDEEAPWATWNKGKPMTAEQFRRRLKPYGIATKKVRTSRYETAQGFDRGQFKDAWSRYLDAGNASSGAPSESRNNGTTEAIQDVERSDRVPIPPIDRNTEHVPAPDATRVPENEAVPIEVGTWNTNGTCKPLKSSGCSSVPVAAPLPAKEEAGALPWSVEL